MADTIFKDNKIQIGHRVKIPKAIIDTLNLKVGQKIIIRFDADRRTITIQEVKK